MKIARFVFQLFCINTYVVWDTDTLRCAVIDPGMSSRQEESALKNFIERERLTVTNLINTHMHIDHVAGNGFVMRNYGVTVSAHRLDSDLGLNLRGQADMFGLDMDTDGVVITTCLNDGDYVRIGNGSLKVLHVPGHSQGGIALYDAEDGFLISGDSLFAGSIGRTDLPGGNTHQLLTAVREKLLALPDNTVVYPGHGDSTTIGAEKHFNPFLR